MENNIGCLSYHGFKVSFMKSIVRLAAAFILATGTSFSQEVAPNAAEAGEKLSVSEILISRDVTESEEDNFPSIANYRVIAKITNRSTEPAINPVFHVSLDSSPLDLEGCASSMILMPHQSAVFCSGMLHTSSEKLKNAKTAIIKLTGDPFAHSGWDRKLENVPKLSFTNVTHRKFQENQFVTVSATFQNQSTLRFSRVIATAVFLDKAGRITGAGPVIYNVKNPKEMNIGFQMPDVKESDRCILQVHDFEEM